MKKLFLMLVAVVVLASPLKANNLMDQSCEDETFAAIVAQTEDMLSCLETLTSEERFSYYKTEKFSQQNAKLMEQLAQLTNTSKILAFAEFEKMLVTSAKKVSKQARAATNCDIMYQAEMDYCLTVWITNQDNHAYYLCLARAYELYERCMAP